MDPLEKNIFLNTPEVTLPQQGSDVALFNQWEPFTSYCSQCCILCCLALRFQGLNFNFSTNQRLPKSVTLPPLYAQGGSCLNGKELKIGLVAQKLDYHLVKQNFGPVDPVNLNHNQDKSLLPDVFSFQYTEGNCSISGVLGKNPNLKATQMPKCRCLQR